MTHLSFIGDAIRQGKARNVSLETISEWYMMIRGIPESALPAILERLPCNHVEKDGVVVLMRYPKHFPAKVWEVWELFQKYEEIKKDDQVIEEALDDSTTRLYRNALADYQVSKYEEMMKSRDTTTPRGRSFVTWLKRWLVRRGW